MRERLRVVLTVLVVAASIDQAAAHIRTICTVTTPGTDPATGTCGRVTL